MAQERTVPDDVREQIHFDTLWSQVQETIQAHSGKLWTDPSEHDPGVTLLQALTFIVADVSYRHTLPLIDLLTPEEQPPEKTQDPEWQQRDSLITPVYGPQRALTCGPVTLDDYRRALLDLTVDERGSRRFCLLDAQLEPATFDARYRYQYDLKTLEFRFPMQPDPSDYVLAGSYQLWAVPHPEISPSDASAAVDAFFQAHRNLCESIPQTCWVKPAPVPLQLVIDVDDDLTDDQAVSLAAKVVMTVEHWFNAPVEHVSANELTAQGYAVDTVYCGPKLEHGWMTQLPTLVDYRQARVLDVRRLAIPLQALTEVKRVSAVALKGKDSTQFTVPPEHYPLVWRKKDGKRDLDQLLENGGGLQFRKRGQQFPVGKELLENELNKLDCQAQQPARQRERPKQMPYGQYRDPARYRSAGSYLPACYGLQQVWDTLTTVPDAPSKIATRESVRQLMLFLLPFEQWLVNRCVQLAQLPSVLSFDRREDPKPESSMPDTPLIWGDGQLPAYARGKKEVLAPEDEPSRDNARWILDDYIDELSKCADKASRDNEKELQILNYLLGYFGAGRAERTLLKVSSTEFRRVQQAYLRQITALTYDRAAISISEPSALQRRIAARLGMGPRLFSGQGFKDIRREDVPFYLIEHRELLPVAPAFEDLRRDWQDIQVIKHDRPKDLLTLTLVAGSGAERLQKGQLIDLIPKDHDKETIPLLANVVHDVSTTGSGYTVEIDLKQHHRLQGSAESIVADYQKGKLWQWKFSPVWLKRKVYDLMYQPSYQTIISRLKDNPAQKRRVLWVESFPDDLLPGTTITLNKFDTKQPMLPPDLHTATIVQIDPVAGCVLAQWEGSDDWPTDKTYLWKWSAPYKQDLFELTLSVVLPRERLRQDPVADPMAVDRWVRGILADEVPSHLTFQLHWLNDVDFQSFGTLYQQWQQEGQPAGDLSYRLLDLLSIGYAPIDNRTGVGIAHILDEKSQEELTMWTRPNNVDTLKSTLVFYVEKD
ncbi:hypothetical protein [Mycetohabitans rhizoxinica]|uniref:Baseplate protein J-like domain-containing protein n=1 Tax=Mycetohabitans rhizoxinica TaxID=412963 RepID=A0ABZ2Q087_9BURK